MKVVEREEALNDQRVFVSVVIPKSTNGLKSHPLVKYLSPFITHPNLSPDLFDLRVMCNALEELPSYSLSSLFWVDGKRDDVSIKREDDVSPEFLFLIRDLPLDINQEGLGVHPLQIEKGAPIVRRLGEGLMFDVEKRMEVRDREVANHP
jgi:hypothetical protein